MSSNVKCNGLALHSIPLSLTRSTRSTESKRSNYKTKCKNAVVTSLHIFIDSMLACFVLLCETRKVGYVFASRTSISFKTSENTRASCQGNEYVDKPDKINSDHRIKTFKFQYQTQKRGSTVPLACARSRASLSSTMEEQFRSASATIIIMVTSIGALSTTTLLGWSVQRVAPIGVRCWFIT